MRWLATFIVPLTHSLLACSSPLAEARSSFGEARYPEAMEQYRVLSSVVPQLAPDELFQYALYRGLCHLALGDAKPASRWLALAKRLAEEAPELAATEERSRLLSAWRSLGYMPGE